MATYTDDFNRANGAIGANYTTVSGGTTPNISSNAILITTDANTNRTAETFGPDQENYLDCTASGTFFNWVAVRATNDGVQYYEVTWSAASGGTLTLSHADGVGGDVVIGTVTGIGASGTHRLGCKAVGNQITGYFDGVAVVGPFTNATWPSGGSPGFGAFISSGSAIYDNAAGGDAVPFPHTIADVRELGGFANSTSGTTMTMTVPAGGVPIGDTIIISGACDNTGVNGVATTVTAADNSNNAGTANTYTLQTAQAISDPGAAAAGVQGFFLVCSVTRSLDSGDTITVTLGNATVSKAMQVEQWSGIKPTSPVVSYTTADNLTGTATSISRTPTAAGQLVMVLDAIEGATSETFTEDTDGTDGAWMTLARRGSGATTSAITVRPSYKLVEGTSAQTWDPVMGTARDHCAAAMVLDFEPAVTFIAKPFRLGSQAVQRAAVR